MNTDETMVKLKRYEPWIRNTTFSVVPRYRMSLDREDVQAECRIAALVALRAWQERGEPDGNADAYVRRAIRNAVADVFRKSAVRPRLEVVDPRTALDLAECASKRPVQTSDDLIEQYDHERAVANTLSAIKTALGDRRYAELYAVHGEGRRLADVYPGLAPKAAQARLRRAREAARKAVP